MQYKLLRRNRPYSGRVFNVIVDDVAYPNGHTTVREVAEHVGGAVVLAVFPDRRIILINQHRYPFNKFIWELPAGKLDAVGAADRREEPIVCAKRELAEETGYGANQWRRLTSIYTSPGFCSEVLHIFLAQDLHPLPSGRHLEEGEETMTMSIVPLDDAIAMIDRYEIVDAKTICGILIGDRVLKTMEQ